MTPGPLIKRLREEKGWSQRELGRRARVHHSLISRLESGTQNDTHGQALQRLAHTLEVTVDELMLGISDEETLLIP